MTLNNRKSVFEKDFESVKERFPKLSYGWNKKSNLWVVSGELDICDSIGVYWNTFNIAILVSRGYPFCVPVVIERSEIIPRHIDWHVSPQGLCCLDAEQSLLALSKKGINLSDFIAEKIYPFFANQLHKLESEKYAGQEYAHHTAGVIQYYLEDLKIPSVEKIIVILEISLANKGLGRNEKCPCASGKKLKHCHLQEIQSIRSFGSQKILSDLESIKLHLN
jgi:hypothetical protein